MLNAVSAFDYLSLILSSVKSVFEAPRFRNDLCGSIIFRVVNQYE